MENRERKYPEAGSENSTVENGTTAGLIATSRDFFFLKLHQRTHSVRTRNLVIGIRGSQLLFHNTGYSEEISVHVRCSKDAITRALFKTMRNLNVYLPEVIFLHKTTV